jgi:predicted DCC family thiol-disulfide oxidoreductase YuxK
MNIDNKYILLFDGKCVLCNHYVEWILAKDKKDAFRFSAQQLDYGKKILVAYSIPNNLSTIALITPEGKIFLYSDVPLEIMRVLGGIYVFFFPLRYIPKFIRDGLYRWVAKNRYKWFGVKTDKQACMLPETNVRYKFLL